MKETNLTKRRRDLYELVSSEPGKRFTKRDIYESVEGYEWHASATDKCPTIREDMKAINESMECEKLIVFDHQMYYVPTKDEAVEYAQRKWRTAMRAMHEMKVIYTKAQLDGCQDLITKREWETVR